MPRAESGQIFTRLMRRGSASSISNSNSPGPVRISPRLGTRPAGRGDEAADRVDVLGLGERGEIEADRLGDFVEGRARLGDEDAVARRAAAPASRPRRARPRCRRRSIRSRPRSRPGRRCRRIRRSPAPCGCATSASSAGGRAPASTAARRGPAAGFAPPRAACRARGLGVARRRGSGPVISPKRGSEARKTTKSRMWIMPRGSSSVSS